MLGSWKVDPRDFMFVFLVVKAKCSYITFRQTYITVEPQLFPGNNKTIRSGHLEVNSIATRLLELWGTTFLPDWQPPLIFVWLTVKSHEHYPYY